MEKLDDIFGGNQYEKIWTAIANGQPEIAKQAIEQQVSIRPKSLFGLFNKKQTLQLEATLLQAWKLIAPKEEREFTPLEKEPDRSFANTVCLLAALARNGRFDQALPALEKEAIDQLGRLADNVIKAAGDYPAKSMRADAWATGAAVKYWAEELARYFRARNNRQGTADTLHQRTRITGAIMNHYPYTLGPDMIETAKAFEIIGETDLPKRFYIAIIRDFQTFADDILASGEEGVWDNDITTMQALHEAYEGHNRLTGKITDSDKMAVIQQIIDSGVTGHPKENHD